MCDPKDQAAQVVACVKLEEARDQIDFFHGPPLAILSDCLRGFLIPKQGYDFVCCDFSSIEARVLAWLADEKKDLEIFRTHGKIYEQAAADIYHKAPDKISKVERQVGKVASLALGYGGGVRAFQVMSKGYGVQVSDMEANTIKLAWRTAHRKVVNYWYDLENAAMLAIRAPEKEFAAGPKHIPIKFKRSGSFLWASLPSKRVLCYPYPSIKEKTTSWGASKEMIHYFTVHALTRKWTETVSYGGHLTENICQAVARDLLAEAMTRLETSNYPVVMHVHDEIVCEVPENFGSVEAMSSVMSSVPAWAKGLPLQADGWRGKRFRK